MKIDTNKKIGICSPSWSGPGEYPFVFEYGVQKMRQLFNMEVTYSTHALQKGFVSYQDRANDIHELFLDDDISFICASIGGSDSAEILPYLNLDLIRLNKKPFMGFSDTTTLLMFLHIHADIPTFHGPSVMAGFAEPSGIDQNLIENIRSFFLSNDLYYVYKNPSSFIHENNNWDSLEEFLASKPEKVSYEGWSVSHVGKKTQGRIYGGSLETLKRMKEADQFNFPKKIWEENILFLETSEERPSIDFILAELDDYEKRGILSMLSGLIFGQFSYRTEHEKRAFEEAIRQRVVVDYNHKNITLVQNINIGHIRPQWIIPIGGHVEIFPDSNTMVFNDGDSIYNPHTL